MTFTSIVFFLHNQTPTYRIHLSYYKYPNAQPTLIYLHVHICLMSFIQSHFSLFSEIIWSKYKTNHAFDYRKQLFSFETRVIILILFQDLNIVSLLLYSDYPDVIAISEILPTPPTRVLYVYSCEQPWI